MFLPALPMRLIRFSRSKQEGFMDRRTFFQNSAGAVGMTALLRDASPATAIPADLPVAGAEPNVIWLLGDQHRSFAISCNGDPNVHTPNMDILSPARESTSITLFPPIHSAAPSAARC